MRVSGNPGPLGNRSSVMSAPEKVWKGRETPWTFAGKKKSWRPDPHWTGPELDPWRGVPMPWAFHPRIYPAGWRFLFPFHRWGNWGTQVPRDLPKETWKDRGRAGLELQFPESISSALWHLPSPITDSMVLPPCSWPRVWDGSSGPALSLPPIPTTQEERHSVMLLSLISQASRNSV